MSVISGGVSGCERYLGPVLPHRASAHARGFALPPPARVNSCLPVRRCHEMASRYTAGRVAAWLRRAHRPDHPRVHSAADWTGLTSVGLPVPAPPGRCCVTERA